MDNIQKLLEELKQDNTIANMKYSGLINDVGDIFERHGAGTTRIFLLEKEGRGERQATILLKVLLKLEKYPEIMSNRSIGRFIFKTLNSIKNYGGVR